MFGTTKMVSTVNDTDHHTALAVSRRQKKPVRIAAPKGTLTVKTSFTIDSTSPISSADSTPSPSTTTIVHRAAVNPWSCVASGRR